MGGTCSKLVSVKPSRAFNNKVHTSPLPPELDEGDDNKVNHLDAKLECKIKGQTTEDKGESVDIFSDGDNYKVKSQITDVDTTAQEQYEIGRGDCYTLEQKSDPTDIYNNIIQVEGHNKLQVTSPSTALHELRADMEVDASTDLNDNSYIRHQIDSELNYTAAVNDQDSTKYDGMDSEKNNASAATRESLRPEGKEVSEEKEEAAADFDVVPQDSLFFLPLDDGSEQRPPVTYKIPERLSRTRKPPLTYNERMLLADCNRFQQLDKRREFAVRRNRSISRLGKLPKIGDSVEKLSESPDCNDMVSSSTLHKPDN